MATEQDPIRALYLRALNRPEREKHFMLSNVIEEDGSQTFRMVNKTPVIRKNQNSNFKSTFFICNLELKQTNEFPVHTRFVRELQTKRCILEQAYVQQRNVYTYVRSRCKRASKSDEEVNHYAFGHLSREPSVALFLPL